MQAFAGTSKITPPRLQRIVERPRLLEVLNREREKPLILVLGQAAQGKSTLITSWVDRSTIPVAWLNLGKKESDPVNLYYLLVQSLQGILDGSSLSHLFEYPTLSMGPRDEKSRYFEWANELYAAIQFPVRIVLDGLDRLPSDDRVLRFLQVLVDEARENIHLVAISRSMPSLEVERLRMDRQAALIDNNALAFDVNETKVFFKEICGISLQSELAHKVQGLTEGWVGGLILLWESLRGLPQKEVSRQLRDGLVPHFRLELFQYFGETILASQPKEVQEFLMHSSILDVIEPRFAGDLSGMENSEEICQDLAARNLFVQTIYHEKKGLMLRYHQLFKDFLRSKFESATSQEERLFWFARAGSLLEREGSLESAIHFYLEAKEYAKAVRVIEKVGLSALKEERIGDVSQWLQTIPEDLFEKKPWLSLYRCMTRRFTAMEENALVLQRIIPQFKKIEDLKGQLLSYAFLIEASFMRGFFVISLDSLIKEGEDLLRLANSEEYLYERTVLLNQIGVGFIAANPRKGFWVFRAVHDAAAQLKSKPLQIAALSHAIFCLAFSGEFGQTDEYLKKIGQLLKKCTHPEMSALYHMARSVLFLHKGDLAAVAEAIHMAQTAIERHSLVYLYPMTLWYAFLLNMYRQKYDEAWQMGLDFYGVTASNEKSTHFAGALWFLGFCLYHKGDFDQSVEYIVKALSALSSPEARHEVILNDVKVTLGFLNSHLHNLEGSEQHLEEALRYFQNTSNDIRLVEVHLAMALCLWENGNVEKASEHLLKGFKIAQRRRYTHFLIISPHDLIRACVLVLKLRVEETSDYAVHLLTTKFPALAALELEQLAQDPESDMKRIAFELQQSIRRQGAIPLRIEVLGNFRILRGEGFIEEKDWRGNMPKNLLKALISRNARQTSREVLMEDLWPESSAQIAENNFKVTLHRLRKTLEPGMDKSYGSSYLHLKDNFLSLDKDLCSLDIEDFFSFAENGQKKEVEGNFKKAINWYGKAVELYRSDFLDGDLYLPWVEIKREAVRRKYIDVLTKIASLWEREGKTKKAIDCWQRIIQTEPFSEEACQKIMLLYANRGMRNAALRVYKGYKKQLKAELDVEPDEVTTSIYRKIAEDAK